MIEMTYNEAIGIQKRQINFYARRLADGLRAELARMTKPCPFDPDEMKSVVEINRLVPRGVTIERLCGNDKTRRQRG